MPKLSPIRRIAKHTRTQLFGVGDVSDAIAAQWDNAIAAFQAKRDEITNAEAALWAVEPLSRASNEDGDGFVKAMDRLQAVATAMDAVASGASYTADTWSTVKSWFGLSGVGGIGVIPAIPLATLAALTGAAIVAINTTYGFIAYINSKTDTFSQLVNAGVDPITANKEATKTAEQISGYTLPAHIAKIAMWVTLGLGIVFIAPRLMKK